jgi:transposase InsO family protein
MCRVLKVHRSGYYVWLHEPLSTRAKANEFGKYQTRAEVKSDIFDYIEGFYNRVRRHKHLDQLSPYEFEWQRQTAL